MSAPSPFRLMDPRPASRRRLGSGPSIAMLASVLLLLDVLGSSPAPAVDGAIEISQTAADLGGVTPGDAPGLPVSITAPGRYVLTSALVVPDAATTAIEVTVDDVDLDLNGFPIAGPALCSGEPVVCSPAGTGVGVDAAGSRVRVRNGAITGMGDVGLLLGTAARVDRVVVSLNGGTGVVVGLGGEVRENRVERNGDVGIDAGEGSLVVDNVVRGNLGVGLDLDPEAGYLGNVLSGNATPQIAGGIELGANACPTGDGSGCPMSQIDCGGLCVDPDTDESHCGACGNACSAGESCVAGTCSLSCQSGLVDCFGVCRDLSSDESHCGGCGVSCSAGQLCIAGTCQVSCSIGLTLCGGTCVDLATDESHCGGCGNACGGGQICSSGACSSI